MEWRGGKGSDEDGHCLALSGRLEMTELDVTQEYSKIKRRWLTKELLCDGDNNKWNGHVVTMSHNHVLEGRAASALQKSFGACSL